MEKVNKPGFILLMSMAMIAAALAIGAYVFSRGVIMIPFASTVIHRQKAKMLALGGVQVAIGQLAQPPKEVKEKKGEKKAALDQEQEAKQFITRLLPKLNRWQQFTTKRKIDGIDGIMRICITSEEGKIPLNKIYNFDTHKFKGDRAVKGDWKKLIAIICTRLQERMGTTDLFASLEKYLKKRTYALNDITELLAIDAFAPFKNHVIYEPRVQIKSREEKEAVYLMDIFSVASSTQTIEPWLLSDSLRILLGVPSLHGQDAVQLQKKIPLWTKTFKREANWAKDYKARLQPIYVKELHSLPKDIESMLSSTFAPKVFSVLSYGTVRGITQRVLAIVERIRHEHKKKPFYDIVVKKIYWL